MQPTELVTLNMRELERIKVIQAVVDRMLKPGLAAERLRLTVRQVERLVLRYKQAGAAGVGSRARGRPGNRNQVDELLAMGKGRLRADPPRVTLATIRPADRRWCNAKPLPDRMLSLPRRGNHCDSANPILTTLRGRDTRQDAIRHSLWHYD